MLSTEDCLCLKLLEPLFRMAKEQLSTFIKIEGSLDQRINAAVGKSNLDHLLKFRSKTEGKRVVDLLLPSKCNQSCQHCYYWETDHTPMDISAEVIDRVRRLVNTFNPEQDNITIYPREITRVPELLPVFSEFGISGALTNAVDLANTETVRLLKSFGIEKLAISLHGDQQQHCYLTGTSAKSYSNTITGIENSVAAGIGVRVLTAVYSGNAGNITTLMRNLHSLGVREASLIRLTGTGQAQNMNDSDFLTKDKATDLLFDIDTARKTYPKLKISLSGLSWGPNFYSSAVYRYLDNFSTRWPGSKYLCPMIDGDYLGISLASGRIFSCFKGLSFPELQIGSLSGETIVIDREPLTPELLAENLQGMCSKNECQYQALCLGGCRIDAYTLAREKGETDPIYAGQDICVTRILDKLAVN